MVRNVFGAVLLWTAVTNALPAVTVAPSQTVEARDALPDSLTDNIFAAAAISHAQGQGFGSEKQDSCDLTQATMPSIPGAATPLPTPTGTLALVAVGRGTQNYTCDPAHPTASPAAVGALATLYDASCVASRYSFLMALMPSIALQFPQPQTGDTNGLVSMDLLGHHYFTDSKSPVFNLDTSAQNAGYVAVQSQGKISAPSSAPKGQNGQGEGAVPWLSLPAKTPDGAAKGQASYKDVYRVNTAGGQPPSTCEDMPAAFEVQYAAEYRFYK